MPLSDGGLGYNEAQNGRIFAVIGIAGIVTQGVLIGPLSRKLGARRMLPLSCFICGTGLVLIPYTQAEYATVQLVIVAIIVAVGSGLFQPSSSSLLTTFAKHE